MLTPNIMIHRRLVSGGEPKHRCMVPNDQNLQEAIPLELKDKKWRYSQCERFVNSSISNDTISCDAGWWYDKSEFLSTIVSDVSTIHSDLLTSAVLRFDLT